MAENKFIVTGDQYRSIDRKMNEIKRQLNQKEGCPQNPEYFDSGLQALSEGARCLSFPILGDGGCLEIPHLKGDFTPSLVYREGIHPGSKVSLHLDKSFLKMLSDKKETNARSSAIWKELLYAADSKTILSSLINTEAPFFELMSLSSIYSLLCLQPRGEEGVLQRSGLPNLFFIGDGLAIRVINIYWEYFFKRWCIVKRNLAEDATESGGLWFEGARVFV